jgi:hypothetical protein
MLVGGSGGTNDAFVRLAWDDPTQSLLRCAQGTALGPSLNLFVDEISARPELFPVRTQPEGPGTTGTARVGHHPTGDGRKHHPTVRVDESDATNHLVCLGAVS